MRIEGGLHDVADFTPVKPGKYEFVVKEPMEVIPDVEAKTDIGGRLFTFIVRPEIVGGDEAGKKLRRQFTNKTKATRYFLKRFLEGIGVAIDKTGGFASEDLLGKKFKGEVFERGYKDGEGQDKKASDIDVESIVAL
jgi:hypothetical protein